LPEDRHDGGVRPYAVGLMIFDHGGTIAQLTGDSSRLGSSEHAVKV